jgi:hypothetical protein
MNGLVSVVDLCTGLVSECLPDLPTLDLPRKLQPGASAVSLDGIGLVHFTASGGSASLEQTIPSPVSLRALGAQFLVCLGVQDADENGWQIFRLCVREP